MSVNLTVVFMPKCVVSMPSVLLEKKHQITTELRDWLDPTVTNKLSQHMASSAGHVPKVPQALFLTRRAMKNRHRSYFPKGDHMLFGILRQEAGLCQALYWILAPVQAVCLFHRWAS